jgi:hypothetical protein
MCTDSHKMGQFGYTDVRALRDERADVRTLRDEGAVDLRAALDELGVKKPHAPHPEGAAGVFGPDSARPNHAAT